MDCLIDLLQSIHKFRNDSFQIHCSSPRFPCWKACWSPAQLQNPLLGVADPMFWSSSIYLTRTTQSSGLGLSSAELVALNLDGSAVFIVAKYMASAFQLQRARTVQQNGPVDCKFHLCAGSQDL